MTYWLLGFGATCLAGSWLIKRHDRALAVRHNARVLAMVPKDDRALFRQPSDTVIGLRFKRTHGHLYGWLIDPWRECSHPDVERIYGDEINQLRGKRNLCHNCGRFW